MKRILLLSLALLTLFGLVGSAAAQVDCPPPPPCPPDAICEIMPCVITPVPWVGGVSTNPEWLKVDFHRVAVTIADQIARTSIELEFVNEGNGLAEGTFLFPLPADAAVDQLIMYINETPIEARILDATEARGIYDAIVRQYRDPALLEYVGTQAVQANVFPIPPGEKRRIQLSYTQPLEIDNGLLHYVYPLDVTHIMSRRAIDSVSISLQVESDDPIGSIYSPSHNIALSRDGNGFRAGFEASNYVPEGDFSLYWGVASETISVNLLTYRESANEDGFFMLMVQPPLELPQDRIVPRDIIVVLDQSGSMDGDKWNQAREAAAYVLDNLNEQDRFNVILFSTGWRIFANDLQSPDVAQQAIDWINTQWAEGGTDINGALTTALDMVGERPATILFMTDGLPTEGETNIQSILDNVENAAPSNARIFAFGVGDDVDTQLLDTIVQANRGTSSYVRPSERIDEEVASLFNKISAPVLTDITLNIDGLTVDTVYPQLPLPDLFAGTQMTIVGRYRGSADDLAVTLSGMVGAEVQTFVYDGMDFPDLAGGEPFIARLWATRRIGELLNNIRLNGENQELVDSIIRLSVRYGIITPYTSFLITEDDILSRQAQEEAAGEFEVGALRQASGGEAVDAADLAGGLAAAEAPAPAMQMLGTPTPLGTQIAPELYAAEPGSNAAPVNPIQTVGGKTFILQGTVWTDTTFEPDTMTTEKVAFLSDAYFDLLTAHPELTEYFALGDAVVVVLDGVAYEVTPE
ncbi:MAG: VWA domain-containing protein [Anaerolineae bacterium]|nr:VWA domain-containing protein [Anaerolineae bacterium]